MCHALIYKKAKFIDQFVDYYQKARGRSNFPQKETGHLIKFLFPGSRYSGRGAFKTVHQISSRAKDLVLKTSHRKNIIRDWRTYCRIPDSIRNRYFAEIYWKTNYCLLQKWGKKVKVPEEMITKLRLVGRTYGLTDIRSDNIRKVDGHFKIVDANLSMRKK